MSWALEVHAFNNSTWEAEAGGFVILRPAWTSQWAPGQPGLHREACLGKRNLSRKKKKLSNEHPFPTSEFSRPFKNLFYYYLCVCFLCACMCTCVYLCIMVHWSKRSTFRSRFPPSTMWVLRWNSGVRSVQQVTLSLGSLYRAIYFLKAKQRYIKQGEETQPQSSGVTAMRSSSTCYPAQSVNGPSPGPFSTSPNRSHITAQ